MQNQHLMEGLEELFQLSYPDLSSPTLVSAGTLPIENTNHVSASGSSGNFLLTFIVVGGVIILGCYLIKKHSMVYKKDDSIKLF
jgi:hypothetical protein